MSSPTGSPLPPHPDNRVSLEVDTIVASSSAAGWGERAVVRLSGSQAHALTEEVLEVTLPPSPGRIGAALFDLEDGVSEEVMLLGWWAPNSLTGEDVVEVHLSGWPVLVTELVRCFVECGARPAARGEFTARALLAGRLDTEQALAVGRLVGGTDTVEARGAAVALTEGLKKQHDLLRTSLLEVLSLIEAHVDFEEEDTESLTEEAVREGLEKALVLTKRLEATCSALVPVDGETDVVLLGPPNAGKSSLFLALCPGATTTVSPVSGTTRDMLEARIEKKGRRWRILDGPGILDDSASGPLDRLAAQRYVSLLPAHGVVLDVEDLTCPSTVEPREARRTRARGCPLVRVRNKKDLIEEVAGASAEGEAPLVYVSALHREGMEALWDAVERAAPIPSAPDLAGKTEKRAAQHVAPLLQQSLDLSLETVLPMVAMATREALEILDQSVDEKADITEEVLDRIYSTYCVGK